MDNKKRGIWIFIAVILVISVFAVMCSPVSAVGNKAMISLKDSEGTDFGVQVSDLEGKGIEIIDISENFITTNLTEEQFEMLKEEGYLVARLKEGQPKAPVAITGPVAIFKDIEPWLFMNSTEAILTVNGIPYTIYSSAQIGVVDLSGFEKVVIASVQPAAFYTAVEANRAWFESYVTNGGVLEIHAAPYGWSPWPTGVLPCGFVWTPDFGNTVDIALLGHEMLTTPNVITDAELDAWAFSYHGYFTDYPAGSQIILTEGDTGFANPVLIVAPYGSGSVIASGQNLEWGYWWGASNLLENIVFQVPEAPPAPVPTLMPIGLIALVGLLSVIAAISIRTSIRKKRR